MKTRSHKRGHESEAHRQAKLIGQSIAREAGYIIVACEYRNSDVIAMRRVGSELFVLALEFERSVRNVVRNVRRNLGCGVNQVIEVCMTSSIKPSVARLLDKNLSTFDRARVRVVTLDELEPDLLWPIQNESRVNSELIQDYSCVDSGLFARKYEQHNRVEGGDIP